MTYNAKAWLWTKRARYYRAWRKRHEHIVSAGLTGGFSSIRRLIAADMFTPDQTEPTLFTTEIYRLVRKLRPEVSVEIGVQRGCSTYAILQALHDNGTGELHSIDMVPDIFFARLVAPVVPGFLKGRWHYHEGISSEVLPPLLRRLHRIDFALHDADHTLRGQMAELAQLWAHGAKAVWVDFSDDNAKEYARRLSPGRVTTNRPPQPGVCPSVVFFR